MSELIITPNFDKKTAKIRGVVAAGEHARVVLTGCADLNTANLRFRVLDCKKTLAIFPLEETDAFEVDGENLSFTLNLNTTDLLKSMDCAQEREFLFILDDPSDGVRTLHAEEFHSIQKWRMVEGSDTPVNLDDYPTRMAALNERVSNVETAVLENKSEVVNVKMLVSSLQTSVNSLNSAVGTNAQNIANNFNDIKKLEDEKASKEEAKKPLANETAAMPANLNELVALTMNLAAKLGATVTGQSS